MPATISHAFSLTVADGTNTGIVRPSDWNSRHVFTLNATGSEISGAFSNANGISFGLSGGAVTASHNALTTAMASNRGSDFVAATAAFAGTSASGTIASNGISVSIGPYITTAMQSNRGSDFVQANANFFGTNASGTIASNGISVSVAAPGGGGGGVALSAGTNSTSTGTVVFADSNGVTFGMDTNGQVTASYSQSTHSHSTAPGAFAAGTQTATSGTIVFANSNNFTFGMSGSSQVTASFSESTHSHATAAYSAANGSFTANTVTFSNANGISFGTSAGNAITASHNALTTARASNDAVGLNTALTAGPLAWTVNSSGISLNAGSAAGTTTGFTGGASISGSMTHNTAGLAVSLSHPAWLTTAALSNHSHGDPTLALTNLSGTTASNSAGFTLSLSAAAPGGGGTTNQTGPNIAAGTQTATSGTVVFSNSNGMVFGMSNSSVVTASWNDVTESMFWRPNDMLTTVGAPINGSASVLYCPLDHNLSFSRFDLMASINVATAANNSSAGVLYSITAALYTLNGGTLSSVASGTTNNQMTWTSNATGSVTGGFFLSVPVGTGLVADKYWVGVALSTRATGLTGANTTSLANTVSMMGVGSAILGAFSAREPGANTANSNGWFYGMGMYSGTTNFSTIGLTNLTQQGTNMNRANLALRMLNQ